MPPDARKTNRKVKKEKLQANIQQQQKKQR
jgi:hypothetical protein